MVVLVAVVGIINLLESSEMEFTLTLQRYILLSTLLSRGLNIRMEVKMDRFPDCEVRQGVILLVEVSSIILETQVNFTVTLMSLTLVRVTVQVRLRGVPAIMGTSGLVG